MFYFQLRFIYACKPESTGDSKYVLDSVMTFLGGAWVKIWGLLLKFICERHAQINPPPEEHSLWASISFFPVDEYFYHMLLLSPLLNSTPNFGRVSLTDFPNLNTCIFRVSQKIVSKLCPFYFLHISSIKYYYCIDQDSARNVENSIKTLQP